jgi:hypothetical protein
MHQTPPTPYADLNSVLRELVNNLRIVLNDNFVGAYLQGSFAVGDFDLSSDCDFIVVTENELSDNEVQALQGAHERIFRLDIPWAQHLEGSYFPKKTLCDYTRCGTELWYLDHGSRSLIRGKHCNTVVVRWVVRENGITLAGPSPETLVEPIPVEALRHEIMRTLVGWGHEVIADPDPYNNRFYQAFIVLNYCRMLHDLVNGFPGSKRAGAEWVKANLDPSWTDLIDRAWSGRPNPAVSVRQRADPQDFKDALRFIGFIIDEANKRYPTKPDSS